MKDTNTGDRIWADEGVSPFNHFLHDRATLTGLALGFAPCVCYAG